MRWLAPLLTLYWCVVRTRPDVLTRHRPFAEPSAVILVQQGFEPRALRAVDLIERDDRSTRAIAEREPHGTRCARNGSGDGRRRRQGPDEEDQGDDRERQQRHTASGRVELLDEVVGAGRDELHMAVAPVTSSLPELDIHGPVGERRPRAQTGPAAVMARSAFLPSAA